MEWGGYESTDAFLSVLSRIPTVPLMAGSMSSVLIKVELKVENKNYFKYKHRYKNIISSFRYSVIDKRH